jgi:para-aminobenzoate synthetase component 1
VPLADEIAAAVLERLPREAAAGAWRRGEAVFVGFEPEEVLVADGAAALPVLDTLSPGLWLGWCAYELGHAIEPVVVRGASGEAPAVPDVTFARFDTFARVEPDGRVSVHGDSGARACLERAVRALGEAVAAPEEGESTRWESSLDRGEFEHRVDAIVEHLRAGDCYQVNLTRRLTCDRALDPVALYGALAARHRAPYAGMLRVRVAGRPIAVVCASPERFLRRRGRSVETKPIKGTAANAAVLRASEKDRAENVMIVDLARNDLGRVCEPGSIGVPSLCALESHPGLHHLVSTVRGRVRADVATGALLAATLPPASVTGAPKPRVLQLVEDLEPVRRGVYCGAFGWFDTAHDEADLAVAIRTFTVFDDRTELGVGAGIVADSSPSGEWDETELKAARLLALAGADTGALVLS